MPYRYVIKGTGFYSKSPDSFAVLENHLFCVDNDGTLATCITPGTAAYEETRDTAKTDGSLIVLKEGQFLLPGFVDTHVHAPQWAQTGKALDAKLPVWLNKYTFPLEAAYADLDFAETVYRDLVQTLLANGTTTAQYFGSVHLEPNKLLADLCADAGQRAFVGKVVMDLPGQCPDYCRDKSAEQALADTEAFLRYTADINKQTVQDIVGVVTPRFIPACSDDALYGLGELAVKYDAPVQSHCSESDWEHDHVLARTGISDTKAHLRYGLLTKRTVLAHSVHLSDDDAELYRKHGASIAHSPLSNAFFAGAVCPVKKRLDQGIRVSLATDLSAGYTPSMFDAMRQAIVSSRILASGTDYRLPAERRGVSDSDLDFRQAFYMATVGGAEALRIRSGKLETGYNFDAFIFDFNALQSNSRYYEFDNLADVLQKIVLTGQRQNIAALWIQGNAVSLH